MTESDSLLQFPCELPIKVFGRNAGAFRQTTLSIVERHFGELKAGDVSEQLSRQKSYASLTIVVRAESRAQMDALYRELTANAEILMVL